MSSFALKHLTLAFVVINFANSFFVVSTAPGVQPELFNLFASTKGHYNSEILEPAIYCDLQTWCFSLRL